MKRENDENAILAYYQGIQDGSITVGKWIRKLYTWIIEGQERGDFHFDQRKASLAIRFMETYCHHSKGQLAPGRLKLSLWQRALVSLIFGVVDDEGKRQFTEVFVVVGRKQGKSLIAGGIGNYMAYAAGEYGSEIYYLAPKLDQADLCYSAFEFNVHAEPDLEAITRSTKYRGLIISETNTSVRRLPFSDRKSDGYNPMMYCADEVASWVGQRGLRQWEVMVSGTGARREPLGLAISSAGYVAEGLYDELMKRGTAVLNGNRTEKHFLPVLYIIDDPAKWDDICELRKSLPGLGESVSVDFILREIDTARISGSKKNEFLAKYCNIPQNASSAWLDAQTVQKAFGTKYTLEEFRGCYALGGLDLSQTTDLSAACVLIEREGVIWIFAHFWLPSERIAEATDRDGIPYHAMIVRGLLSPSGDQFVDYHDVYTWFEDLVKVYDIRPLMVGYDRYSAQYLVQDMQSAGFHMESVFQGYNLTGIMDNMEGLLREGTLRCADENDLLKVHLLDAAQSIEASTAAHPRKKLAKISKLAHVDGVAAILDALCMRQVHWAEYAAQLVNEG